MTDAPISKMYFGDVDARNELGGRDKLKRELLLKSFLVPPSLDYDGLLRGYKFLIVGPKGAGKTAVLRHLSYELKKEHNSTSRFVVFKEDVSEKVRNDLLAMGGISIYENDESSDEVAVDEAIVPWTLLIHREIARLLREINGVYAKSQSIENYMTLVEGAFGRQDNAFRRLIARISGARFKVSIALLTAETEFKLDKQTETAEVPAGEFVRILNSLLSSLHLDELSNIKRLDVFFDELNVAFKSRQQYKRDSIVVRDLISACGSFNLFLSENDIPIYIYTALRSEIAYSIEAQSRELNKWIEDSGTVLDWFDPSSRPVDQPIIKLVQKRIIANEAAIGRQTIPSGIWNRYFDTKIYSSYSIPFVLYNTWARPRDVVRILNNWKKYVRDYDKFNTRAFDAGAVLYSRSCWDEKRDELNALYPNTAIESLEQIFLGFQKIFTFSEFCLRCESLKDEDPKIGRFLSGRNLRKVIQDLFFVGVIGNAFLNGKMENYLYKYNGKTEINFSEKLCLHRSLWLRFEIATSFSEREKLFAPFQNPDHY